MNKQRKTLGKEKIMNFFAKNTDKIIIVVFAIIISLRGSLSIFNNTHFLSTDVSVWTVMAKMMKDGKIVYSQIFDHKGPILYLFYFIGYFSGGKIGIWLVDLISVIISAFMMYIISKKFIENTNTSLIVTIIGMIFIACFYHENPGTESLSLPFILIALNKFIDFVLDRNKFGKKESLITGLCLGTVVFIRPNLIALWIVYDLYIFFKLIKEKEIKKLINIILFSFIGLGIVAAPIMLYLVANHALTEFFETYIIFNLRYSSGENAPFYNILSGFLIKTKGIIAYILVAHIVAGGKIISDEKNHKDELKLVIVNFVFYLISSYFVLSPLRVYLHYAVVLIPTAVVPLVILFKNIKVTYIALILIVCVSVIYVSTLLIQDQKNWQNTQGSIINNTKRKSDYVNSITDENDNVLQLGNNMNFYILSDRTYNGKYIYQNPLIKYDKEIEKEFIKELKKDLPVVIVDYYNIKSDNEHFKKVIREILAENYEEREKDIYVIKGR